MRIPLLLYGLALVVRALLIWHFPDPAYPDSAYYVDVARALHDGQGFNIDFIWIFPEVGGGLPANPVLPIPSNAHWMPLASIVQVPFLALFGNAAWASAAPFALFGALAAPLTWAIARDAGATRFVSIGAGILVAIPLLSTVYIVQPDNFSLYQPLVAASLWMGARGLRGSARSFVLAGLLAGLATLARNDGLFVLGSLGLVFAWDRWRTWRSAGSRRPAITIATAMAAVAVFVLVMSPWWFRQLAVFGSLSPSTGSGKVLFIRDIGEWNSITTPASLEHLLGMGPGPLIATRIGGAIAAAMIYLTLVCGFILAPILIVGSWVRRRSPDFLPFFVYAAVLFTFSALVSAVHVPGGTFIHSAVALAPHSYILALEGLVVGIGWIAARRSAWDPVIAVRVFGGATIAFSIVIALAGALAVHSTWAVRRDRSIEVANALTAAGSPISDRVMSIDASSTRYWTGHGGVVLVNDPLGTIEDVARAYDIRWLVLDRGDAVPAVAPILDGSRPDWLGAPILESGSPTDFAIYPSPGDAVTRREAALSAVAIFVVALLVRAFFAAQIVFPKPEDTAYYVGVARNLIEGRGLVSDALWSYQTLPLTFPREAFEVWLPLPTLLAAIPMALLGATFAAAQWSSVLVGSLVPVLAWRLAADVAAERNLPLGRARTLALGTGLTTALYLPLLLHSSLPDSTMPFAVLAIAASLLMMRIARDPRDGRVTDRRVFLLGVLIGLAALTRNEAVFIGLAWAIVAWNIGELSRPSRVRLVAVVGLVAGLVFLPWAIRDWVAFGSPLPGQAVTNAFSVTGFDIFAWNDPPTLSRYLAVGPARLVEMRVEGFGHNLLGVLLLPGLPISLVGLIGLPWIFRARAIRPIVVVAFATLAVTSLVFPIATTWGTFLHTAGPFHVLLVISALLALDALIARLGSRLGWTKPVAWLGALLGIFGSVLFSAALLPSFGAGSRMTAVLYDELKVRMVAAGHPLGADGPVITNFPIWLAETQRISVLALPDEPPRDVLDLASTFKAHTVVLIDPQGTHWPADLDAGAPGSECFRPIDLGVSRDPAADDPLADVTVYEIACP